MEETRLKNLLNGLKEGEISVEEAIEALRHLPFEDMGFAKIDHHRTLRRGFPEVIFCEGKRPEEIAQISKRILSQGVNLLATRCTSELFSLVEADIPGAVYHEEGRLFAVEQTGLPKKGRIAVVSGGTSDRPVAEEAALTAHYLGCEALRLYDVGVAGLHRLLEGWKQVRGVDAIVVVAGMEGALASVVAGLADAPIIAVPTSVGYGASFGGISALLTMLNSCAGGVTVVNIDNGFGAGYAAAVICHKIHAGPGKRCGGGKAKPSVAGPKGSAPHHAGRGSKGREASSRTKPKKTAPGATGRRGPGKGKAK
jgi:NCAIR mutase (PurE)-related protein